MNLNAPLTIAPETKQKWRRRFKYGGIILISLFAINLLIIEPIRVHRERQQFEKAAVQLESIATQIQAKIGKADDKKVVKSCHYASREFEKGPLSCGVSTHLLYTKRTSDGSNNLMAVASKTIPSKIMNDFDKTQFEPKSNDYVDQSFSQDISTNSGLVCGAEYTYPVVNSFYEVFKVTTSENLEIALSCGGPAMAEYYTVTKP